MPERPYKQGDAINEGVLLRRVYPTYFTRGLGILPPSSQAFQRKKEDAGVSAFLESECSDELALDGNEGFALVEIPVTKVIELGFRVTYEPIEGPPGHVLITGEFTEGNRRRLAAAVSRIRQQGDPTRLKR